ncbi:unnamed protein product [Chironomus riparius]|uniref:F-box domain-containing protein n=1 Tax=Chironomus riparius TaxID=315576 RepID=A0A9P0JFA8_9DIPT|nr:unnamed protein product [Chironomus riparius]
MSRKSKSIRRVLPKSCGTINANVNRHESTFEKLSTELTELIFSHLDTNSIKSCLEVSKSLRNFIINSPKIMKNLKLHLAGNNWKSKAKFIKKYGKYIQHVDFECTDERYIYFMFMHLMPNVTKLSIDMSESHSNKQNQKMPKIFENISKVFSRRSQSSGMDGNTSEANPFNQLSPELIELILTNLDVNSLKACLHVSIIFRDVIIRSSKCMNKIPVKITNDNWKSMVPFLNRDYGPQFRNVEFHCFNGCFMFYRLLIFMPNITKLKITMTTRLCGNPKDQGESDAAVVEELTRSLTCKVERIFQEFKLTKLENLEISFFKFDPTTILNELLCCKNVKKFHFHCTAKDQYCDKVLRSFLQQQKHLKHLELEVAQIENIFMDGLMNFELTTLKIVTTHDIDNDYSNLNRFLLTQSDCLEELRTFPRKFENIIIGGILSLKNLKKLTTHGLLPCFKIQEPLDPSIFSNLTYYRFSQKNKNENFDEFDLTCLPNLKCLNVQFGSNFVIVGTDPIVEVTANPLRNLTNLKEFHIDSHDQGLLKFLASSNLESLVIPYDDDFYDIETSIEMTKNLPNLHHLTIMDIKYEKFFKFVIENYENLVKVMKNNNHGLKTLELHFSLNDVLKLIITNGEVTKAIGSYTVSDHFMYKNQKLLKKKFKNFNLSMATDDEYNEKYELLHFY